jgi:hypothetical protein
MMCAPTIYTANTGAKNAECFAYSKSSGTFIAVGGRHHLTKKYPNAYIREVEKGMTILPGLYDSHGHIMLVRYLAITDLMDSTGTCLKTSIYLGQTQLRVQSTQYLLRGRNGSKNTEMAEG